MSGGFKESIGGGGAFRKFRLCMARDELIQECFMERTFVESRKTTLPTKPGQH